MKATSTQSPGFDTLFAVASNAVELPAERRAQLVWLRPELEAALCPLMESPADPAVAIAAGRGFFRVTQKAFPLLAEFMSTPALQAAIESGQSEWLQDLRRSVRDPVAHGAAEHAVAVLNAWSRSSQEYLAADPDAIPELPSMPEPNDADIRPWLTAPSYMYTLLLALEQGAAQGTLQALAFAVFDEANQVRSRLAEMGVALDLHPNESPVERKSRVEGHIRLVVDAVPESERAALNSMVRGQS